MEITDHLWMRLQHLDERGGALLDINWDPTDPIREAREAIATTIMQPTKLGPLRTAFHQFEPQGSAVLDSMLTYSRDFLMNVDAQVDLGVMGERLAGRVGVKGNGQRSRTSTESNSKI